MFSAAGLALSQMFSPPFRAALWKSISVALILIVLIGIGLHRMLTWLVSLVQIQTENALGVTTHIPSEILAWLLSFAAGLGIIGGSVFLMPAVTAAIAGFFVDEIADNVEREHYPADPAGAPLPMMRAVYEGVKIALLSVLVYLIAVPFLLFAGFGAVIFFLATAYLLGRQYFELAAMRYQPVAEAKRLRKSQSGMVFLAGLFIAAFVSVPVLNLATPLFGMAFMIHIRKRMTASARPPLLDHAPL